MLAIQASRTGWALHADAGPAAAEKVVLAPVAAEVMARELSPVVAAAARESRRETGRREYCMMSEELVIDSLQENESSERIEGFQKSESRNR